MALYFLWKCTIIKSQTKSYTGKELSSVGYWEAFTGSVFWGLPGQISRPQEILKWSITEKQCRLLCYLQNSAGIDHSSLTLFPHQVRILLLIFTDKEGEKDRISMLPKQRSGSNLVKLLPDYPCAKTPWRDLTEIGRVTYSSCWPLGIVKEGANNNCYFLVM